MAGRSWASIFTFLWFLIYGILAITNITFAFAPVILGVLAILICIAIAFNK